MDAIGEAADGAVAGIDQSEPQVAAVEPKRRQHAAHAAGGIDNISGGRMRVLIVLGVIGVVQADALALRRECRFAAAEENRGAADRICGIDMCFARIARALSMPSGD